MVQCMREKLLECTGMYQQLTLTSLIHAQVRLQVEGQDQVTDPQARAHPHQRQGPEHPGA